MPSIPKESQQRVLEADCLAQKIAYFQENQQKVTGAPPRSNIRPLVIMEKLILGSLNLRCFFSSIPVDFLSFSFFCVENYLSFSPVLRLLLIMANRKWVPTTMARACGAEDCQCWWEEWLCHLWHLSLRLMVCKHWQAWPGDSEGLLGQLGHSP